MRLQLSEHRHHTEVVTAACWTPSNELYTCSDDQTICKWGLDGELQGEVCKLDTYVTGMFWFQPVGKQDADTFVVCCSDGTLRFMNKNGREEKKVQASKQGSAVIKVQGNVDGQSLVSAAEDGSVKVWSRSGNLRSTLARTSHPVYSVCWGPDSDQVLYTCNESLHIQTLQAGKKNLKWKAHAGVILCTDWNAINGLIVSCGEDCTYKGWDDFGRELFKSKPFDSVLTSIAWSPNGECFAVGAFNMMRLCDRTGWSHCRELTRCGSVMEVNWTTDGTLLAGAGGNGAVLFGQVLGRRLQWDNVEAQLIDPHKIRVQDVVDETVEELDFRDRVLEMALGFGHLVVCTATQCHIYSTQNWNTPHIFDVRDPVRLIVQSTSHFLTVDAVKGVQAYTYEGHKKGNPRDGGLRPKHLSRSSVALCADAIAILDQSDSKTLRLYDVDSGRSLPSTIEHALEITQVALSQSAFAKGSERKLTFIDRNRDLYITSLVDSGSGKARRPYKLQAQVDTAAWNGNEASDVLLTIADGKATSYYYPNAAYIDPDLLRLATEQKDAAAFGKAPEITSFFDTRAQIRRQDGSIMETAVSPTPAMLYDFVSSGRWDEGVRLCRYVKSDALWATLAAMALHGRHLDTAEIAFAALNEVDKLHYVLYIQSIPSEEGRQAELALWRREPDEAEHILLQASPPLVYRAIKMNIRLFRWERALEVAVKNRAHVDTVLAYRQKYLEAFGKKESLPDFKEQLAKLGGKIDLADVEAKKKQEKEAEAERAGGAAARSGGGGEEKE